MTWRGERRGIILGPLAPLEFYHIVEFNLYLNWLPDKLFILPGADMLFESVVVWEGVFQGGHRDLGEWAILSFRLNFVSWLFNCL